VNRFTAISIIAFLALFATSPAQTNSANYNIWMNQLGKPGDTIYIEDRKKLVQVKGLWQCKDSIVGFDDTLPSGDKIIIRIENMKFQQANHKIHLYDTVFKYVNGVKKIDRLIARDLIDGKLAYGVVAEEPRREIRYMEIIWNGHWLNIPESATHNLYDVHLCHSDGSSVQAYISQNGKLLYVYLTGSDGAGGYAAKLIFNRKRYLTRIINTNEMLDGYDALDETVKDE
jgi:hypothetical protein